MVVYNVALAFMPEDLYGLRSKKSIREDAISIPLTWHCSQARWVLSVELRLHGRSAAYTQKPILRLEGDFLYPSS